MFVWGSRLLLWDGPDQQAPAGVIPAVACATTTGLVISLSGCEHRRPAYSRVIWWGTPPLAIVGSMLFQGGSVSILGRPEVGATGWIGGRVLCSVLDGAAGGLAAFC